MQKRIAIFLALALALVADTGCSLKPATVQAAQITPTVNPQPACFPESFYRGLVETPDYLSFASQACFITVDVKESYTLKYSHLVQAADLQMGSNANARFEWAFWVDFQLPSGREFRLFGQYDKHQDNVGNVHEWRPFPVPLVLPAGTVVTIVRPSQPLEFCIAPAPFGNSIGCATGQKVELVGVVN